MPPGGSTDIEVQRPKLHGTTTLESKHRPSALGLVASTARDTPRPLETPWNRCRSSRRHPQSHAAVGTVSRSTGIYGWLGAADGRSSSVSGLGASVACRRNPRSSREPWVQARIRRQACTRGSSRKVSRMVLAPANAGRVCNSSSLLRLPLDFRGAPTIRSSAWAVRVTLPRPLPLKAEANSHALFGRGHGTLALAFALLSIHHGQAFR